MKYQLSGTKLITNEELKEKSNTGCMDYMMKLCSMTTKEIIGGEEVSETLYYLEVRLSVLEKNISEKLNGYSERFINFKIDIPRELLLIYSSNNIRLNPAVELDIISKLDDFFIEEVSIIEERGEEFRVISELKKEWKDSNKEMKDFKEPSFGYNLLYTLKSEKSFSKAVRLTHELSISKGVYIEYDRKALEEKERIAECVRKIDFDVDVFKRW